MTHRQSADMGHDRNLFRRSTFRSTTAPENPLPSRPSFHEVTHKAHPTFLAPCTRISLFFFVLLSHCAYSVLAQQTPNRPTTMKVIDLIHKTEKTAFSFEILPPIKGTGIDKLYSTIDLLREFDPQYINITTHRSEYVYKDLGNGLFQRNRLRRRPGTVAVAAAIQNKYDITVVPHILCSGFTREETEYVLLDLQFLNITDLLVLRGDKARHETVFIPEPDGYRHATELQEQINRFNQGIFVDGSEMTVINHPFSYGVACYPEKHEESPNMETDLYWLKKKVEAGAEYAVTQLFYDNRKYFDFVKRARAEGIDVPIIPGIKPLRRRSQLNVVPKTFKVDLPDDLVKAVEACSTDEAVEQVGVEWCVAQCKELMAQGVPSIHFYSIGSEHSIYRAAKQLY